VDANLRVKPSFSYAWSFRVPINFQPGIYRIVANMNIPDEEERELARKLHVLDAVPTI
jgi:hypothetical protein